MNTAESSTLHRFSVVGVAVAMLTIGTSSAAASTDTTEPGDAASAGTEAEHSMETTAASLAVDGSAEPSSPEAAAFCDAEVAAETALASGDASLVGPAFEAVAAAAPEDIAATVGELLSNEPGGPEFAAPYAEVLDWMRANCGFAELTLVASEYAFGGFPPELPIGPTIIALENIGSEVHEVVILKINDGSLSVEELFELPEEEAAAKVTEVGFTFAFPGTTGQTVVDLVPGRYVALCYLPQNADPEIIAQMGGPEDTAPEGANFGPPHFTLGMIHEFHV